LGAGTGAFDASVDGVGGLGAMSGALVDAGGDIGGLAVDCGTFGTVAGVGGLGATGGFGTIGFDVAAASLEASGADLGGGPTAGFAPDAGAP
jgi:hypothetical protein